MVEDEKDHTGQCHAARGHTIQVDYGRYVVDLNKELEAGRKRAQQKVTV